jgi:hypothetical protein
MRHYTRYVRYDPLAAIITLLIMDWVFRPRTKYKKYLKTDHWQQMREKVGERAGWVCEVYGCRNYGKGLNIHHLNYARVGHEKMSDLVCVCQFHHKRIHSGESFWSKGEKIIPAFSK